MRYAITPGVSGIPGSIEISADEFAKLRRTQKDLIYVLNSEETFDLLLENYAEFESEFLRLSLRLSLFGEHGEPLGPRREMNRRLANLLSSVRLYLDQVPQDLNSIYGKNSAQTAAFNQCRSKQYDSSLAYRVMESLRNYAQHCGFPVHAMTLNLEREEMNVSSQLRAGLRMYIELQRLKDREFKRQVLDELAAGADREHVNLTPFVREYIERLCEVHESMRGWLSADVATWDQIIIAALDRARAAIGQGFKTFEGFKLVAGNVMPEEDEHEEFLQPVESEEIFIKHIEWRKTLEIEFIPIKPSIATE